MAFNSEVFYVCLVSSMVFGSEGLFQLSCGLDGESRMFVDITSGFLLLYTMANGVGECQLCTSLTGASLEFAVRSQKVIAAMCGYIWFPINPGERGRGGENFQVIRRTE